MSRAHRRPSGDGRGHDDRRATATMRRARRAGAAVSLPLTAAGAASTGGAGPRALVTALLLALVAGVLTASGWLLTAVLLDLLADRRPTRRLLAVTAAVVAAAFVSPILVVGAAG